MPEKRNRQIVAAVERTFYSLIHQVAGKRGVSTSTYVRDLIIKDLDAQGLITEETLRKVTGAGM